MGVAVKEKLKYWGGGGGGGWGERAVEFPTLFFIKLKISHVIVWEVAPSS